MSKLTEIVRIKIKMFRLYCRRAIKLNNFKYSSQNNLVNSLNNSKYLSTIKTSEDVKFSRKKTFFTSAAILAGFIGFSWYVNREKNLG